MAYIGNSNKPDILTFFGREISRENSFDEDIVLRSRSASNASFNSGNCFFRHYKGNKKFFNLAAYDGIAMIESVEDRNNLNNTVLEGMNVAKMCEDIDHHNQK